MLTLDKMIKGLNHTKISYTTTIDSEKKHKTISFTNHLGQQISTSFENTGKKGLISTSLIKDPNGAIVSKLYKYDTNGDVLVLRRTLSETNSITAQIINDIQHDRHGRVLKHIISELRPSESSGVKTTEFDFSA